MWILKMKQMSEYLKNKPDSQMYKKTSSSQWGEGREKGQKRLQE